MGDSWGCEEEALFVPIERGSARALEFVPVWPIQEMLSTINYLKILDFFQYQNGVFDKPTSFFFMVGGLWAAICGVLGNPIL